LRRADSFEQEKEVNGVSDQPYESPQLSDLGAVREITFGSAADDTADMNTSRYY
jgi:hypothetical protein